MKRDILRISLMATYMMRDGYTPYEVVTSILEAYRMATELFGVERDQEVDRLLSVSEKEEEW